MNEIPKYTQEQFLQSLFLKSWTWLKGITQGDPFYIFTPFDPIAVRGWKSFKNNILEDMTSTLMLEEAAYSANHDRLIALSLGRGIRMESEEFESVRFQFGVLTLSCGFEEKDFHRILPLVVGNINYNSGEFYYVPNRNKIYLETWNMRETKDYFDSLTNEQLLTPQGLRKSLEVVQSILLPYCQTDPE